MKNKLSLFTAVFTMCLLFSPSLGAQSNDEAEKLFDRMEVKLRKAETIQLEFRGTLQLKREMGQYRPAVSCIGKFSFQRPKKVHFEVELKQVKEGEEKQKPEEKTLTLRLVSNGSVIKGTLLSRSAWTRSEGLKTTSFTIKEIPEDFDENLTDALSRSGLWSLLFLWEDGFPRSEIALWDFRTGREGRIGNRSVREVTNEIELDGTDFSWDFIQTACIDVNDDLPLRRHLSLDLGKLLHHSSGMPPTFTENAFKTQAILPLWKERYLNWKLDKKIDPAKFKVD